MKRFDIIFSGVVFGLIITVFPMTVLEKVTAQQGPEPAIPKTETRPFTPMGKLAAKQIHQEIQQVQADIQEFIKDEMAAQGLSEKDGWSVDLQSDQMVRRVMPPPPAPKPPVPPNPTKPSSGSALPHKP